MQTFADMLLERDSICTWDPDGVLANMNRYIKLVDSSAQLNFPSMHRTNTL